MCKTGRPIILTKKQIDEILSCLRNGSRVEVAVEHGETVVVEIRRRLRIKGDDRREW